MKTVFAIVCVFIFAYAICEFFGDFAGKYTGSIVGTTALVVVLWLIVRALNK